MVSFTTLEFGVLPESVSIFFIKLRTPNELTAIEVIGRIKDCSNVFDVISKWNYKSGAKSKNSESTLFFCVYYTDSKNETFFVGKFQNQEILKELRSHIPKIIII